VFLKTFYCQRLIVFAETCSDLWRYNSPSENACGDGGLRMRAVVQRVRHGQVMVDGKMIAKIGRGLVILLGIGPQDDLEMAQTMARKIALLRIFEDEQGKMNLSLLDVGGAAIVVS